ncbi:MULTISPECIES: O-antigen ligase family protein [Pedobacter]|uniref:O-antigen ligase family protein n=1 Tax=Pedobacter TaxID=84567 RepID=UPI00292DCB3A|nr:MULTISPECIES: O-antigen ligase family protein [Pedobacter]
MFFNVPITENVRSRLVKFCICIGISILLSLTASITVPDLYQVRAGQIAFFSYGVIIVVGFCLFSPLPREKAVLSFTLTDVILVILILLIGLGRYSAHTVSGFSPRLIELIGLSLLYLFLRFNPKLYIYFLYACVVGCLIQAFYGLLQLYGFYPSLSGNFPITGTFFNPGPLSGYVLYGFCVTIGLYLSRDDLAFRPGLRSFGLSRGIVDRIFPGFLICCMVCFFLVLSACKSRASWLGLVIFCSLFFHRLPYFHLSGKFSIRKIYIFILLGLVMLSVTFLLYYINRDSSDGRLLVWEITGRMVSDNPIFGSGFDNFSSKYMAYQSEYFRGHPSSPYRDIAGEIKYPFNILMVYLSENGIIGAVAILVIMVRIMFIRKKNALVIITKAVLSAQIVFALFSYSEQILPIKLNVVCSLAFLASSDTKIFSFGIGKARFNLLKYSFIPIYLVFSVLFALYLNKMVRSYRNWGTGSQISDSGQFVDAVPFFVSAHPFLKTDGLFLMQYGNLLLKANEPLPALKLLDSAQYYFDNYPLQIARGNCFRKLKRPDLALASYMKASDMIPSRLYPRYLQVISLLELNNKESAVKSANNILKMAVKINSPATREIKTKMAQVVAGRNFDTTKILSIINK